MISILAELKDGHGNITVGIDNHDIIDKINEIIYEVNLLKEEVGNE